jgi:hypothetical protein
MGILICQDVVTAQQSYVVKPLGILLLSKVVSGNGVLGFAWVIGDKAPTTIKSDNDKVSGSVGVW